MAAATNQVAQLQGQLTRMTEEHRQQSARDRTLDKLEASGPQPLKPGDFAPMYKGPGGLPEDGAPMYKGPGGLPEDGAPMYKGPGGSIPEARNLQLASAPTAKSTPIQKLKEELAVLRDMIQKSCYDGRITDRERDNIDQARISLAGKVNLELPKEAQAIARTKEKLLKARAAGNEKQALRLENQLRSQQSELDKKIDRTLRWIEKQK